MPTAGTRALLTITSFAPLWLGLALLEYPGSGWAALPMYLLAVLSPLLLWVYLRRARRIATTTETVARASRREQDVIAYVATYLVPFAVISVDGWRPKVVVAIFLVTIIGLCVHARVYYVNPLLAAARYHVFEISLVDGTTSALITHRSHVPAGSRVQVRTLGNEVLFEAHQGKGVGRS